MQKTQQGQIVGAAVLNTKIMHILRTTLSANFSSVTPFSNCRNIDALKNKIISDTVTLVYVLFMYLYICMNDYM